MTEYRNYYHPDHRIQLRGNLYPLERLPDPDDYWLDVWFSRFGELFIDNQNDAQPLAPSFCIGMGLPLFGSFSSTADPKVFYLRRRGGGDLGWVDLVGSSYAALHLGHYTRPIEQYIMTLTRAKGESQFLIQGRTGRLADRAWYLKSPHSTQSLGKLSFSIWFYLRDARIKHAFRNAEDCRLAYEKLIKQIDARQF